MRNYDGGMASTPRLIGPSISEFLERAIREREGRISVVPLERVGSSVAMVVFRDRACAIGVELVREDDSWVGRQVVVRTLNAEGGLTEWPSRLPQEFIAGAIQRVEAREQRQRDMRHRMTVSREFIAQRLDSWKDKTAPRGNAEYAALAAAYCEELRRGNTKATTSLGEQLGISAAMMAQRIKEARRRRLLTPGQQGRASGELTRLGLLYTDPEFPGLRQLRLNGKSVSDIAEEYQLSKLAITAALVADGAEDLIDVDNFDFDGSEG